MVRLRPLLLGPLMYRADRRVIPYRTTPSSPIVPRVIPSRTAFRYHDFSLRGVTLSVTTRILNGAHPQPRPTIPKLWVISMVLFHSLTKYELAMVLKSLNSVSFKYYLIFRSNTYIVSTNAELPSGVNIYWYWYVWKYIDTNTESSPQTTLF